MEVEQLAKLLGLSVETCALVQRRGRLDRYESGAVLCRRGELGLRFYIVISGGVVAYPHGDNKDLAFYLGVGQIIGELSLIKSVPVSATIICDRPTQCLVLEKEAFLQLLQDDRGFQKHILDVLCDRVIAETRKAWSHSGPQVALVVLPHYGPSYMALAAQIKMHVQRISPASHVLMHGVPDTATETPQPSVRLPLLQHRADALLDYEPLSDTYRTAQGEELDAAVASWRAGGPGGSTLVVVCNSAIAHVLARELTRSDCVVDVDGAYMRGASPQSLTHSFHSGLWFEHEPSGDDWSYRIRSLMTIEGQSTLAALSRWITWKEIGVALGSGTARGFAHIGVLAELTAANIPVDCIVGTSMGGIVAAVYAKHVDVDAALEEIRVELGSRRAVFDRMRIPRQSFFLGRRIAGSAERVFGDQTFADLRIPCAVLATDVLQQEGVVFDTGPVGPAILATSAMPTVFPPVKLNGRLLLDGALARRVPVELLDRRRCGFRLAVSVIAPPRSRTGIWPDLASTLLGVESAFGFRKVLAMTWEFLNSWYADSDQLEADFILEPDVAARASTDFDAFDFFVSAGRDCAREQIPRIRDRLSALGLGR